MREGAQTVRLAAWSMGCRFELVIAGPDPGSARAAGEEALAEVEAAHARLTRFERGSVVSRINAAAGGPAQPVDAEVFGLLALCEEVRAASGGGFDVTAGPDGERAPLELDPRRRTARLTRAGARLDLGGVGKGFAADLARAALDDAGVGSALLHAGTSTVAAVGTRPDGEPWTVRVGGPGVDVALAPGETLSVSGDAVQRGHIFDPRTGAVRTGGVLAACVAGADPASGATADAWSTAIAVLGGPPPGLPGRVRCVVPAGAERIGAGAGLCSVGTGRKGARDGGS